MKNVFTSGMILFLAMTTMVSCTQENVMLETTPQVKNQEVRFCFFESSIVPIGQDEESNLARTRADGSEKSLKDANLYTDLQVCLIPKGDETTAGYTVRQENWDDEFGNVSLQVPAGEYTLVAVAAKTDLQQEERIEVKSRYVQAHHPESHQEGVRVYAGRHHRLRWQSIQRPTQPAG